MSERRIEAEGGCACGAVAVRVSGPALSMLLCCCLDCRKATGAGHSAGALFSETSVSIAGQCRGFARIAASGATITRYFCPSCGTPVHARTERAPDCLLLPAGLFADSSWFAPRHVLFARSHLDWDALPENLPMHETYPATKGF